MLSFLTKKKLTEDKLAQFFVNSTIKTVEEGFPEVCALINEDPEFLTAPQIGEEEYDHFLMIILAGNLEMLPQHFMDYQDIALLDKIYRKLSISFNLELADLKKAINSYQQYMKRVNHPSKNTHYAMSKAVFYKYGLNEFQQDYFRKMKTPNPIFLKRLDELIALFIWDWTGFKEKFKIVH